MNCKKCGVEKPQIEFSKDKSRTSGYHPYCKQCTRAYGNRYAATHRDAAKARAKTWYAEHPEAISAYYTSAAVKLRRSAYMRAYRKVHTERKRETAKAWHAQRVRADINYRLATSLRKRLSVAIRANQKGGSAVHDLGCTISELKSYLERMWLPGMTWDNWSRMGWHIDHVTPLASFDLTDPAQCKKALHYTNLQPLWCAANYAKGSRLPSSLPESVAGRQTSAPDTVP